MDQTDGCYRPSGQTANATRIDGWPGQGVNLKDDSTKEKQVM